MQPPAGSGTWDALLLHRIPEGGAPAGSSHAVLSPTSSSHAPFPEEPLPRPFSPLSGHPAPSSTILVTGTIIISSHMQQAVGSHLRQPSGTQ